MRVTNTDFIFPSRGGERSVPHGLPIPDNATNVAYDPETMLLAYTTPANPEVEGSEPQAHDMSITQTHIDNAISQMNAPSEAPVPGSVTKAQLKLALLAQGIDLQGLIAQLPAEMQPIAQILVDNATHFERSSPMVEALGGIAGLSAAQVDDVFRAASAINPATL